MDPQRLKQPGSAVGMQHSQVWSRPHSRAQYQNIQESMDGYYRASPYPDYWCNDSYQRPELRDQYLYSPSPSPLCWSRIKPRSDYNYMDNTYYRPHSRHGYEEWYRNSADQHSREQQSWYYHNYPRGHLDYGDGDQRSLQNWQFDGRAQQSFRENWDQQMKWQQNARVESGRKRSEDYGKQFQYSRDNGRDHADIFHVTDTDSSQVPVLESSQLAAYKESGLSNSSYELSQYLDYSGLQEQMPPTTEEPTWLEPSVPSRVQTPWKHPLPHVRVSFTPQGHLIRVCPNMPSEGEPAVIEIHSLEVILYDTKEQEEMREFPGPLLRDDIHKMDVLTFAERQLDECQESHALADKNGAALLWQLLIYLCRQNGMFVHSDVAELLARDYKNTQEYNKPETAPHMGQTLMDLPEDMLFNNRMPDLLTGGVLQGTESSKETLETYTQLLMYGRKKEALEWAIKGSLWGHALFLASKMDSRIYSDVMGRFTSSLAFNDPLQTLFQLMSGRIPKAAVKCGDVNWGDWRPHLAVILSNKMADSAMNWKAIVTMGDTLASKGQIDAAHFCYLMADIPFGNYGIKTDKLVLLGCNHRLPFYRFALHGMIQRTEILEYCWSLARSGSCIPTFQVYKLLYASRLVDYGLPFRAFQYCEVIGKAVLQNPKAFPPVLLTQLIELAERLKYCDSQAVEKTVETEDVDSDWLIQLRMKLIKIQMENLSNESVMPLAFRLQDIPAATTGPHMPGHVDLIVRHQQNYIPQQYSDAPKLSPHLEQPVQDSIISSSIVRSENEAIPSGSTETYMSHSKRPPVSMPAHWGRAVGAGQNHISKTVTVSQKSCEEYDAVNMNQTGEIDHSFGTVHNSAFSPYDGSFEPTKKVDSTELKEQNRDEVKPQTGKMKQASQSGWFRWLWSDSKSNSHDSKDGTT
ncbi:protein transport protein Sec16B-like [Protopterus annectens]|uniref:protein transport protein Sec16B-like n=1 Tax=Protopterus annectens TaxID=7888 RepID=UPI001CFAFB1C|nr:protein transport protein Sec16B-like [Protopterus annectens]